MCSRVMCVRCNCSTQREWVLENRLKKTFGKLTGKVKKKLFSAYENESCTVEWWCAVDGGWFPVEYGDIEATFFDENAYRAKYQERLESCEKDASDAKWVLPEDLKEYSKDFNMLCSLSLDTGIGVREEDRETMYLHMDSAFSVYRNPYGFQLLVETSTYCVLEGSYDTPEEVIRAVLAFDEQFAISEGIIPVRSNC